MNHSKQSKIKSWFHEVYSNDNIKKPIPKKTVIILLSFIITLFFFNFLLRLNAQKYPEKDDYFYATNTFKLKKRPLNKKYIEQIVKKSHLHYALVAPFAERKLNFFNKVKYINLVFGIMMILTVFFCGKILFSDFAGL
ncbi:MAG: hypothetical protein OEZ36_14575, partial [Spirochaetota bacterium]|nr:hypothetical protein [Spirochaetota bacterium]